MKVWLFKNIVFRYVALATKKLWAILDFFPKTGLFSAVYQTLYIKKNLQQIHKISL